MTSAVNTFTDAAVDAQYQWLSEHHVVSATLTYMHEDRWLDGSNQLGNAETVKGDLQCFKVSLNYLFERTVGARLTFNTVRGSSDATWLGGSPRSTAFTAELFANPWVNTKLGVMYTAWLELNGAERTDALKADTLFAYLWLAY